MVNPRCWNPDPCLTWISYRIGQPGEERQDPWTYMSRPPQPDQLRSRPYRDLGLTTTSILL